MLHDKMTRRILLFSDNGENVSSIAEPLEQANIELTNVRSIDRAQQELRTRKYQVFISRCEVFNDTQFAFLQFMKKHRVPTVMVIVPKHVSVENTARAIKMGARDVIVKEMIDAEFLEAILENTEYRYQIPATSSRQDPAAVEEHTTLIGNSPAMCEVRSAIELVSNSQAAVLITGESGTGKEVVARLIPLQSDRKNQPFIALNCAALPKDIIENELFGHEKGAFTGALIKKIGAFELAHGGTLFFDEITEMSPDLQAKLLRAIEYKVFRRLGGKDEIRVDIRVIAATNKSISAALASGELREDLYYRFSVIEIALPPLRERKEDVPLLLEHFLSVYAERYGKKKQQYTDHAMEMLCVYNWPGNVRELRNIIERNVVTCPEKAIGPEYLPPRITNHQQLGSSIIIPVGSTFEEAERKILLQTLSYAHNNISKTARILGLSRKTVHNKLRQLDIPDVLKDAVP